MKRMLQNRLLHWTGTVSACVLTGYFVLRLVAADWSSMPRADVAGLLPALTGMIIAYAVLGAGLAAAWAMLLAALGGDTRGQASLHARTQVLKYLPGNIFHLAGRHALARRRGVSHEKLLQAGICEAVLLAVGAGLTGLLCAPYLGKLASQANPIWPLTAGLLALSILIFAFWQRRRARPLLSRLANGWHGLGFVLAIHSLFFVLSGCLVWGILVLLGVPEHEGMGPTLIGAMALAWLAGFLTPGAPAGLGVREGVLLVILSPAAGTETVIALAALFRIVTVLGDAVLALAASAVVSNREQECHGHVREARAER